MACQKLQAPFGLEDFLLHGSVWSLVEEDPPIHALAPSEAEEHALPKVVLVPTCAAYPGASLECGYLGGTR